MRRWQLFARTEGGTRKIMQEQIRALEQKCARERIQAEARASLITASEHRHTMAEKMLSMLVAERVGWMLRDSFIHWRCVAEGVVLPCLRRKDAFRSVQRALLNEEGDEQRVVFGRFQSARLRRKAFMYWVAQIRDLVIRRMQVEDLLSVREAEAMQVAFHVWSDQCLVQHNLNQVEDVIRIFARRDKQVWVCLCARLHSA